MGNKTNIRIIAIIAIVAVAMAVMDIVLGDFPLHLLRFPINILIALLWLSGIVILYRQRTTSAFARFMLSGKAMWLSFLLLVGISIYLGLKREPSGSSWIIVTAILFILSHLTLVVIRGWRNKRGIRWRFTILHLGLLLALGSGFWGAPDREQLRIAVDANPNDMAYDMGGKSHILDYELRLSNFNATYSESGTPDHYEAVVEVDGTPERIRVNHPYAHSWMEKIYLISLNKGDDGESYCILEVVREPWQWLSTTGIVMLIAGAAMMFLGGARRRDNES